MPMGRSGQDILGIQAPQRLQGTLAAAPSILRVDTCAPL